MLTPAERRGALVLAFLMTLGTGWDLWQAHRPPRGLASPPAASDVPVARELRPAEAESRGTSEPLPAAGSGKRAPERPLDLNRAGSAELARLPGIGPVLAGRIVAFRRERGAFGRPEDLLAVRGVGPRLFQRLKPYLALGAARDTSGGAAHAFRTEGAPDSVQILLQSRTPAFR